MKELFQELLNGLKATDLATRVVIGMSVVLLAGVMAVVGMWASKPHMVPLHTGLDDTQFSAATRALATSGIGADMHTGTMGLFSRWQTQSLA